MVLQRVNRWPVKLTVQNSFWLAAEIFSNVNGVPLHTAFHDLSEISLKSM